MRFVVDSVLGILGGAEPTARCAPLIATLSRLLDDDALDPAFREQLFTLPSEGFIAEQLPVVDAGGIRHARDTVRRCLADALQARWRAIWTALC